MPFFMTDGGNRTMAGVDGYGIGQYIQFVPDTVEQGLVIATRQIRPANAFVEEYIAPNQELLVLTIKTNASRGMTGCKDHPQLIGAELHHIIVFKKMQWSVVIAERYAPFFARLGSSLQDGFFVLMKE